MVILILNEYFRTSYRHLLTTDFDVSISSRDLHQNKLVLSSSESRCDDQLSHQESGRWRDLLITVLVSIHTSMTFLELSTKTVLFGVFYRMTFDDFCQYFVSLAVCQRMKTSPFGSGKKYDEMLFHGEWVLPHRVGGCINNQKTFLNNPQVHNGVA